MDVRVKFNLLSGLGFFSLALLVLFSHINFVRLLCGGYILILLFYYDTLLKRFSLRLEIK